MKSTIKRSLVWAGIVGVGVALIRMGAPVMAQSGEKPTTALVCTLTTPELQERRMGVIKHLRESAAEVRELDAGWSFRYSNQQIDKLVEFIQLERKCCSFLEFALRFEANAGPVWLSISGPTGAKSIIAAELRPTKTEARPKSK